MHEGEGAALKGCTAGAADAVDVILIGRREVIVDDVRNGGDIEAACGDVGRHEDTYLPCFEGLQRANACIVGLITVNALRVDMEARKGFCNLLDSKLRAAEDKYPAEFRIFKKFEFKF